MHSCPALIVLVCVFCYFVAGAKPEGHFVDLNNVVVITDSFSEEPSYFGFSFILRNHANDFGNKSWVLIGAPKGDYGQNSSNNDFQNPGVLWRCSLGAYPEDNCEILPIDPTKSGVRDCRPNRCPNESKNNSWLGMTLATGSGNSSRLIACAPQWKREENPGRGNYKFNGLCYWLPANVVESEPFQMRSMIRNGFTSQRLFPFVDAQMQTVSRFPVYASGEVGFSSHLTPDGMLYLGAPGVNGWNGSVVRFRDGLDELLENSLETERANQINQTEFSKFSIVRTEVVEYFHHLEYFGYAVTSGVFVQDHFYSTPFRLVAAGAPRGGLMKGIVLLFRFPENVAWLPDIVVQGTQFGSYFGSVLCATDLNGDGMDELIVGSPLQSLNLNKGILDGAIRNPSAEENPHGSAVKVGDQGCIFVYSSKIKIYGLSDPEIICGTNAVGSKFGTAMTSLGDINGDGFNDLAVGAPFENNGEGAVYIYAGGPNFGLDLETRVHYLKITPSILNLELANFGISIFGDVDLDGNTTPDFGIGSHVSQAVVIVRTRPRIKFEGRIDVYINETEAEKLPLETNFMIRSCSRMLKGPTHAAFDLTIQLTLDKDLKRFRIHKSFEDILIDPSGNSTVEYKIKAKFNETNCYEWLAHSTGEVQLDQIQPKPLTISQQLLYEEQFHDLEADLTSQYKITRSVSGQPELNISGPGFHDFCSFCPPRTVLITQLHVPIASDNCMEDENPICEPDLQIYFVVGDQMLRCQILDKYQQRNIPLHFSIRAVKEPKVTNTEDAETAYFPFLDILWKSPPLPEVTANSDCALNLTEKINNTFARALLQCDLGYTLQPNESRQAEARLFMHGMYAKKRVDELNFEVSAYQSKDLQTNITFNQTLNLALIANAETFILGSLENVTFMNDSLINLTQTFRISLLGESPIESIRMAFLFPIMAKIDGSSEEQLVFISQPERSNCWAVSKDGNYDLETYQSEHQPFPSTKTPKLSTSTNVATEEPKLKFGSNFSMSTDRSLIPKEYLKSSKAHYQFHCKNSTNENCLQVECEKLNIVPNNNFLLEFRLSIDSELARKMLTEMKATVLEVRSLGFVQILDDTAKFSAATTRLSEIIIIESQIGIWIYILSAIVGIIFLILLILLLIRCGFFERPARVKAELHPGVQPTEPRHWARWEYSQIYNTRNRN